MLKYYLFIHIWLCKLKEIGGNQHPVRDDGPSYGFRGL